MEYVYELSSRNLCTMGTTHKHRDAAAIEYDEMRTVGCAYNTHTHGNSDLRDFRIGTESSCDVHSRQARTHTLACIKRRADIS